MKIQKGKIYRFKSWEQMKREFGLDENGNIPCRFTFASRMRYLCGKEYKEDGYNDLYKDGDVWKEVPDFVSLDMLQMNVHKRID